MKKATGGHVAIDTEHAGSINKLSIFVGHRQSRDLRQDMRLQHLFDNSDGAAHFPFRSNGDVEA
ncbi:hypothetical protein [Mesorhizobium carmichaelinearum]|uniref:hypothetical protein n=1 Tax=Mesorhizobium carmichaelinearum TaxID=1208188 RepID=UPI00117F702A|nr:hypothetical protein [Mesorhizobium carmichaelinearum]